MIAQVYDLYEPPYVNLGGGYLDLIQQLLVCSECLPLEYGVFDLCVLINGK